MNISLKNIFEGVAGLACIGCFGFAVHLSNDVAALKATSSAQNDRLARMENKLDTLAGRETNIAQK